MLRAQLVESRVEGLEFLLDGVFVFAAEGFDDGRGVDDAVAARGGTRAAVGVLDVHEGGAGFAPGVEVSLVALFAPGVDFRGMRGGGFEDGGEVGGADHTVDNGDAVGEEDAEDGLGF